MAARQQCREPPPNRNPLPPLRELLLEIQVNKLIRDYLFSSPAQDIPPPLHDNGIGPLEHEENRAFSMPPPSMSHAAAAAAAAACRTVTLGVSGTPLEMPTRPLQKHQTQSSHEPRGSQTDMRASSGPQTQVPHKPQSDARSIDLEDTKIKVHMLPHGAQSPKAPNLVCDARPVIKLSTQNEGAITPCLSRLDTFPCTNNAGLQMGLTSKETKVSPKKPPRPPKLPISHPNKLSPSLSRCFSDMGPLPPSSRRAKLEKKRKSSASSSVDTSLWAFLFTFCFALIMIGQGFHSPANQDLAAALGTDAWPPTVEGNLRTSILVVQEYAASAGARDTNTGGTNGIPRRVEGEAQAEVEQMDFGT